MQAPLERFDRNKVFGQLTLDQAKINIHLDKIPNDKASISEFFSALENHYLAIYPNLEEVSFKGKMSKRFAKLLGKFVASNKTIRILDVEACNLNATTFSYIAEGLKANNSIFELNIGRNQISDVGINTLASILQQNQTLRHVALNGIVASGQPLASFLKNRVLTVESQDIDLDAISKAHNLWNVKQMELIRKMIARSIHFFNEYTSDDYSRLEKYGPPQKAISDYVGFLRAYVQSSLNFKNEDLIRELTPAQKAIFEEQVNSKIKKAINSLIPHVCTAVLNLAVNTSIHDPSNYSSLRAEIQRLLEFFKATGTVDVAYEQLNKLAAEQQKAANTKNPVDRRKALLAQAIALTMISPDSQFYGPACHALAKSSFTSRSCPAITLLGAYRHLEDGVSVNDPDCKKLYQTYTGTLLATAPDPDQPIATLRNSLFSLTIGHKLVAELKSLFESTLTNSSGSTLLTFFFGRCMPIQEYLNPTVHRDWEYKTVATSVVQELSNIMKTKMTTPEYILMGLTRLHSAIAKMRNQFAHDHEHAPVIEAADHAIGSYLKNATFDRRPALIQNMIWRMLEDGKDIVKKVDCTNNERELYNSEALKKMLDLNAYHPESAKTLLACADKLRAELMAPDKSVRHSKAIVRELDLALNQDISITNRLSVVEFDLPDLGDGNKP